MSFLQAITPINLQTEKERFFADPLYNPQFQYDDTVSADKLLQYGQPEAKYEELAHEILNRTFATETEESIEAQEGPSLTQNQVTELLKTFLRMHKLQDRFELQFSASYISRTSISSDTIKLRLPVEFRHHSLLGMLYHEIGTHALRRINYEQQPWYKKKKKFGFAEYLVTEEGLASLHGLLPQHTQLAYKQARLYYGISLAQQHSFSETWHLLERYITSPEKRWTTVVRLKRGLQDTTQPGGYTKDLVYFKGFVETWQWLAKHGWDCTPLYYGKLAAEDVGKARELAPDYTPLVPSFFLVDPHEYAEQLAQIGKQNLLDEL